MSDGHRAFPSVVFAANNSIVVAYRKGTTHAADKGTIECRRSVAYPWTSWTTETTIVTDATWDVRTHTGMLRRASGQLILPYFKGDYDPIQSIADAIWMIRSSDNGATWGSPEQIPTDFTDVESNGWITEIDGDLHAAVSGRNTGDTAGTFSIGYQVSTNDGVSWSATATIMNGHALGLAFYEPSLHELANGDLFCLAREESAGANIYYVRSTNGGSTWSAPAIAFSGTGYPAMFVDSYGSLWVVYRRVSDGLAAWRASYDDGATWTSERLLSARVQETMVYGSIFQDVSGFLACWAEQLDNNNSDVLLKRI